MWALIKDDKVEQIISYPTNIEIDNIKHSFKIFNAWTWDELNAIGIYQVIPASRGDDRFELTTNQTFTFDASKKQVTMSYTIADKNLADIKALAIAQVNREANMLI